MEKKCQICSNTFHVANWNKDKKFCSRECYWTSNKVKLPDDQKLQARCEYCKVSYPKWRQGRNKGKFCSRECWRLNQKIFMTNRIVSEVTRKKLSDYRKTQVGELSSRWIKDRTKVVVNELEKFNSSYRKWMLEVKNRDGWKCRIADENCSGRLECHHILSYTSYPELRYKLNNGITLCHAHHPRKKSEEKRLISTFQELVSVSKV